MLDSNKRKQIQITHEELRALVDEGAEIVKKLCIEGGVTLLPLEYDPDVRHPKGHDSRPDIVKILDLIATDSHVLKMPEDQPYIWRVHCQNWTDAQKETFNYWRLRIERSEVSFD
jgi:hypothetical protein